MRVLAVSLVVAAGCVSPPASTPTLANDARNHDPWLDGGASCAGATSATSTDLKIEDVVVGDGRLIIPGDTVRVHYLAADATTSKKIHDSRADGPPLEIVIGSTKTLCGFDQSLVGMHAGGQRRVTVPSRLAFGDAGRAPDIAPNEDLVFTIDLFVQAQLQPGASSGGAPPPNPARGGGGRRR